METTKCPAVRREYVTGNSKAVSESFSFFYKRKHEAVNFLNESLKQEMKVMSK
jgi:hypothetical protein